MYGKANTTFSSNFLISRATRMLTEVFDEPGISQIFSTIIYNLVMGELI